MLMCLDNDTKRQAVYSFFPSFFFLFFFLSFSFNQMEYKYEFSINSDSISMSECLNMNSE